MFDIVDVEREWAKVCPVDAHTILHRSTEVVRAARRLPADRLEPHAEFSAGVFWKFLASLTQSDSSCLGLGCVDPRMFTTDKLTRGFSAGSYVGAAVALIACRISQSFRMCNVGRHFHESSNFGALVSSSSPSATLPRSIT